MSDEKMVPFPSPEEHSNPPAEPKEPIMQLGLPGTEPFTTPLEEEVPPAEPELAEQPPLDPVARIPHMEDALRDIYQRVNLLLGLVQALGEHAGLKLKSRQVPTGGVQFYWESAGKRIILPNGRTN